MRRVVVWVTLIGLVGCRSNSGLFDEPGSSPPPPWTAEMQTVADGNNRFACDLYGKLREQEKGNVFFSPYSAHSALAMTATGAKGATRDQMVKVLHLPADRDKSLVAGDVGRFYAHPRQDYALSVANALWGQKGFPWRAEFLTVQKDRFGAGFQEADFQANPDAERQRINRWVEDQTRDRIKELILPNVVTRDTRMVLANAIYFKGQWLKQFDPKATQDAPFHLADGGTVSVPIMSAKLKCRHSSLEGLKVLELLYKGGELAMVVLLPDKPNGLPDLERQLTADTFEKWLAKLHETEIQVSLPRFRFEQRFSLNDPLIALGMTDAFGPADFSGMATSSPGSITAVVHKAFVDVNEEGTEAAAATAVVVKEVSASPSFRADHPFLFLVRDVKHGTILFMGRVMNPKSQS